MNKIFFVYVDWTLEDVPRCFYVGKGNEARVREHKRNLYWQRVACKYGWRREVVFVTKEEKAALDLEIELVAHHKTYRYDNIDRWGCNFTRGGDGTSGHKHSKEHRSQISGEGNPFYGKKHSEEFKRRLSDERKGEKSLLFGKRGCEIAHFGRKHSLEQRKKFAGENHGWAKMTWEKVDEIRLRHANGESQDELARAFNVSRPTIHYIVRYKTWKLEIRA